MTSPSDVYERVGFRASEIYPFLESHGVVLRTSASASRNEKPTKKTPDWVRPYIGRKQIALGDAAAILAGLSPAYAGHRGDEEYAVVGEWRAALLDASGQWGQGEIDASSWSTNQDAEQLLWHSDIRAWCVRRGHDWPIPDLDPQPATSAQALAEIKRLKAELDRYKAELDEAREGVIHADHPQCAPELDIAMTAWRAAVNGVSLSGRKPGVFLREWLDRTYGDKLTKTQKERIATVANWDKTPGPK